MPPRRRPALRILQVVDSNYPAMGGAEIQARFLARTFLALGHRVEVAAPQLDRSLPPSDVIDGVPVTRIAYPRIKWLGAIILCIKFGAWLWRRRDDFDAVHVHIAKNLAAVAGLLRPFMPWTLTIKVSGAWEFKGGILDPERIRYPVARFYNWCIRRADTMQCISEQTREMLAEAGYPRSMLRLIPNAVDLERYAAPENGRRDPGAPLEFVYVGRLERVKGVDVLVDAWARSGLASRAHLTIAGSGREREALEEQARQAGVAASIDFLGAVDDVPVRLARAAIYVQPSRMEGLSNAMLEAMAVGLPIVATRCSGSVDIVAVGVNGLLVEPEDAVALAAALASLAADPSLAARMGAQSRRIVEARFGTRAVVSALERAYLGAAGEPPPAANGMNAPA